MLGVIEITAWHYGAFIFGVLLFVALDLFVFHRQATVITFKEALLWTGVTVVLALLFGALLLPLRGRQEALEFFAGYLIELSLSMDNVFVIALIYGAYYLLRRVAGKASLPSGTGPHHSGCAHVHGAGL